MSPAQDKIFSRYKTLKPDDWYRDPIEWEPIQWHLWGALFTDMGLGFGKYFKSYSGKLKEYLNDETLYLVCGNKDDLILLLYFLCHNDLIPIEQDRKFVVFKITGNKNFVMVDEINLLENNFDGTAESEVHFKIFCPLSKQFADHLLNNEMLNDSKPMPGNFFKILGKRLPPNVVSKLNKEQKAALLAGMIDGDGTAGILVVCPNCKKRNTIRSERFNCEKCNFDLKDLARSMDYNIMLDSAHFERLQEEFEFLAKEMGLKGHLYVLYVQKEKPDKMKESLFNERKEKMEGRIKMYEKLTTELKIPIVIKRHILRGHLPSYHYAPDVYGSIKFLFTPHFKKTEEKIKWYGVKDIHSINLPIIKQSLPYMFINKKRAVFQQVMKNKLI